MLWQAVVAQWLETAARSSIIVFTLSSKETVYLKHLL